MTLLREVQFTEKGAEDMTVQIIEIAGQKMAMLPAADYDRLIDIVEDKADIADSMQAEKRRHEGEEYLPSEMVDKLLAGENPLKIWRKHRGMTQTDLATRVGRQFAFISKLERGYNEGGIDLWLALAKCLDVTVEDIHPAS